MFVSVPFAFIFYFSRNLDLLIEAEGVKIICNSAEGGGGKRKNISTSLNSCGQTHGFDKSS